MSCLAKVRHHIKKVYLILQTSQNHKNLIKTSKRSIIAYKSHKTIKEYDYNHFLICHGPHRSQNYKIKGSPPLQRSMAYIVHKTIRNEDHHNFWVCDGLSRP
jgi:hypothetical protein